MGNFFIPTNGMTIVTVPAGEFHPDLNDAADFLLITRFFNCYEKMSAGFDLGFEECFELVPYLGGYEGFVLQLARQIEHTFIGIDERPALGTLSGVPLELFEGFHVELVIDVIHDILDEVFTHEHIALFSVVRFLQG